ncbi:MAG: long-chain fatty acid--CoA ligase [Gammaproteobacteria bacterium]|nr:long-chain fatty acid--CoA ligase [Gammaproteobacteria bacterium]
MSSEDLISIEAAVTLDGLFRERVRRSPEAPAYRYFSRDAQAWRSLSWRDMGMRVARWQQALAAEGFSPGDRVAILLRNGPDWAAFDIAALSLGLVVVPLYVDDRPDNAAYILNDAWCRLLVVQSAGHWRRLDAALSRAGQLTRVVILEGEVEDAEGGRLAALHDWLPADAEPLPASGHDGQALASIVYTSGTTGRPKGVMLSHHNMLSVAHAVLTMIDVYQEDEFVSFLPLSHTLERTGGYYLPMMAGATVSYARSVAQLAEDLASVRPTILIAVPRIFERVYGRIQDQLASGSMLKRGLFKLTVRTGWRRFERGQGRARWSPALLLWPLLRRLVADKVLAKLGGRLRAAVSGGAAIPEPVSKLFIGLGLPLLQGYGLTESSPVISVNTFQDNDPPSVGIPIRGTEVRIGADDELLARGPGVMLGYWNNHTATREMIDSGGWLHTGDQARIEDGHIYITGRLKDILVMSNGEKVPPADMEAAIMLDSLFDQALVVGEGRPYLTAIIVPDPQHWFGFVRELGLDPYDRAHLENEKLEVRVIQRIRAQLHDFPGYAKIRRVALTLDPWTLDEGLVTPTMKIKRAKVLEQYADRIAALYD